MQASPGYAAPLPQVIKVGTSSLVRPDAGSLNLSSLARICETVRDLRAEGHRVVLVSSGAVGVGAQRLGLPARPADLAQRQALAAVGQVRPESGCHSSENLVPSPSSGFLELLMYTHASTHVCLLEKHLQDILLKARDVLGMWQAAARYMAFGGSSVTCVCVRQVYLMRYYEDFFSALGLVRTASAWRPGRACTRASSMRASLYS